MMQYRASTRRLAKPIHQQCSALGLAQAGGQIDTLTGGMGIVDVDDLTALVERQIRAGIDQADAVLVAKVMRLGRTLAFCTCEIAESGSDKPAAFSTGTYAIL